MSRSPRLNIVNGIYHTMARGNRKATIFEDACDRQRFVKILAEAAARYGVEVLSECRMFTHYHLVVRTPRANLPAFHQYLNGVFAAYSNRRHGRIGHVFGDRYKPLLVDNELYLRVVLAYVAMNPVVGNLVATPADWQWSSYRTTIGLDTAPSYLSLDWLDAVFPGQSRRVSQTRFAEYVAMPMLADAEEWLFDAVAGPPSFTRDVRAHIGKMMYLAAVPRAYRALGQPPLDDLLPRHCDKDERARAILRSHVVHGYTMSDIARSLGVHLNTVSRIVRNLRRRVIDA